MTVAPLQLKIKKFYNELNAFANNNRVMFIYNDLSFFRKCGEIWNKITELIGINKSRNFVETDYDDDELIMVDVCENTSFIVEDNCRYGHNKVAIVLHSVQKSLVQHRY